MKTQYCDGIFQAAILEQRRKRRKRNKNIIVVLTYFVSALLGAIAMYCIQTIMR